MLCCTLYAVRCTELANKKKKQEAEEHKDKAAAETIRKLEELRRHTFSRIRRKEAKEG